MLIHSRNNQPETFWKVRFINLKWYIVIPIYYHISTDGRLKIRQLKQSLLLILIIDYLLISNKSVCQRRMIVKHLLCSVLSFFRWLAGGKQTLHLASDTRLISFHDDSQSEMTATAHVIISGLVLTVDVPGFVLLCWLQMCGQAVPWSRSCCFLIYCCCCIPFLEDSHSEILLKVTKKVISLWEWTLLILRSLKEVGNNFHTEGWCNSSMRRHKHQSLPSVHCMEYESFVLQVLSGSSLWQSCVINGSV